MAADGGSEERTHGLRLVATGAAVVVLIGLAGVTVREAARLAPGGGGDLSVRAGPDRPQPDASARAGAVPPPVEGVWHPVPPVDLAPRSDPVVVWTGREAFVWGGWAREGTVRTFHDGALYDPLRRQWTPVAAGPPQRWQDGVVGVWTGSEVLVVGGRHRIGGQPVAQAYVPDRGTWRRLPRPPDGEWLWDTAVWTGTHLVVLAVSSPGAMGGATARYDPVTDRWRRGGGVSTLVLRAPVSRAVWLGEQVVVSGSTSGSPRLALQSFDPLGSAWRQARAAIPEREWIAAMATDGRDVLLAGPVPGGEPGFFAARWSPDTGWRPLPDVPERLRNARPPRVFATDDGPLLWPDGDTPPSLLRDGVAWQPLPPGPVGKRFGEGVVWTRHGLFVWGGHGDQHEADGAVFAPRPQTTSGVPGRPPEWDGRWTELPSVPEPVDDARLFAYPGGIAALLREPDGDLGVWRLTGGVWEPLVHMIAEHEFCTVLAGTRLLLFDRGTEAGAWRGRAVDVVDGSVSPLPPAPLPVRGMVGCASWRFGAVLVSVSGTHRAATAFDPATRRWTTLPDPPVDGLLVDVLPASDAGETTLLVVTDVTVARLDEAGKWSSTPTPRNLFATNAPALAWTGDELLVWGGVAERPLRAGWRWHEGRDRWRQTEPAWFGGTADPRPHAWSGTHLVVWGEHDTGRTSGDAGQAVPEAGAYDPRANQWSSLPERAGARAVAGALWDAGLVVVATDGTVWRFNPR